MSKGALELAADALVAIEGLQKLAAGGDPIARSGAIGLATAFYDPDVRLAAEVAELERLSGIKSKAKGHSQALGNQLERVAYLVFRSLKAPVDIKSYRAPDAQHDLIVYSPAVEWEAIASWLGVDRNRRYFLVECKAESKPLSSKHVSRACSNIVHSSFSEDIGLAVFFTLLGETGAARGASAEVAVRDARLRRLLFYVRDKIPVVVFDLRQIRDLLNPGGLFLLLHRHIREVVEQTGLPMPDAKEIPTELPTLPTHLRGL